MRRAFIAGNWKMNLTKAPAVELARAVAGGLDTKISVEVAVCPPSVYLQAVAEILAGTSIGLGAQNMYHEKPGAFTGEISPEMVVDVGCKYVILGHSERRNVLGETNQMVNEKVRAALAADLIPIVCLGELLEQREAGQTLKVIQAQFDGSFHEISAAQMANVVIAYEPVWAIGTGKVATPQQAEDVHLDLRRILENRYNAQVAGAVRIQYGGSVKPENARELLAQPNIDGALVGGASLVANDFLDIVEAAVN
jgi:triosephosphate isomerase